MKDETLPRLGQYILGERIAAGGMAEIYHASAVDPGRFSRPIVLKRMHQHLAEDRDFVNMFIDEARISSRLNHPNIVKLFDFEAAGDGLYIILEYINGPDLLTLLKGGARRGTAMPPEIAVYITCHVLEALDYAHGLEANGRGLNIVHRDVSPGNVLISTEGRVKLTDFGIARANDRQKETAAGTMKGKYGYMSPEQIEARHLDGRSDLFSAGIVLAELLMSKRLFSAPNQLDVLLMVRNADLSRFEANCQHVEPGLVAIITKALARKRDERYETAGDFRDALATWLATGKTRMNTAMLRAYISELEAGEYIKPSGSEIPSSITMSGTMTQAALRAARSAAQLGRELFELGTIGSLDMDLTLGAAGVTIISERPHLPDVTEQDCDTSTEQMPIEAPDALDDGYGKLGLLMPLDLIGAINANARSGLLTLERDRILKEAYFLDGHPVFVGSNDPQERFGQFLVMRDLISPDQLERAIATMPHFGGRLGHALVGLELLRPVDAVHLLAEQVAEKLLRCCCWEHGSFLWEERKTNPHTAVALHLSSCRIVARGVQLLSEEHLIQWARDRQDTRPDLTACGPFDAYGFGPALSKRLRTMDGSRSIGDLLQSASGKSVKILSAAVYALLACNAVSGQSA